MRPRIVTEKTASLAVLILVVIVLLGGSDFVAAQDPDYVIRLENETAFPGQEVDVSVSVDHMVGDIQGFSFGVCSDGDLLSPIDSRYGDGLAFMNGGNGPDHFYDQLHPGEGINIACIFSWTGAAVLPPGLDQEITVITYETFEAEPTVTPLVFCEDLGDPPFVVVVVVGGQSIDPIQEQGSVELVEGFVRGDSNASGSVNIADPIHILNFLFQEGPSVCMNAMDSNNDSQINIADALYLLMYINGMGPQPVAPFPQCGPDDDGGALGCEAYDACL